MENNRKILSEHAKDYNFLLDTSAIRYLQIMHSVSGASIFKVFEECPDVNFFVANVVLSELMNGPNALTPIQIGAFLNHILNSESSMMPERKENRFLVEENGEVKYVELNKISSTDYAQVLLCQNHTELILVTNDKKLIRSAAQVVKGRRVVGIPALFDKLLELYPNNERVKKLKETGEKIFSQKHAFEDIKQQLEKKSKNKH